MKRVYLKRCSYYVLLLTSLTLSVAHAQPTPFEGANVILISTDLADRDAYMTVGRVLSSQGISFEPASDHLLISLPVSAGELGKTTTFVGQLSISAGLVQLTGRMQSTIEAEGNSLTRKSISLVAGFPKDKRKASASHLGFVYLNEIAKKLYRPLHGIISYKIQPQLSEEETTDR